MKITREKVLAFQNTNYNFTLDRISHLDLERLEFELKRFTTFKTKIRNTSQKVEMDIQYNNCNCHIQVTLEQMVIGAIEQFIRRTIDALSPLDELLCISNNAMDNYNYMVSTCCFRSLKERLDNKHLLLSTSRFEQISHEYIYHKNKTQKEFYEVYYTNLCNQFESYLKYLENFDTGIIELYFAMCDNFFVHKYNDKHATNAPF